MHGFRLWNTYKLYAPRRPDGAGDDYNPSIYVLGLKTDIRFIVHTTTVVWKYN